jgi:methionine-rich copper-binding protein CopC
MNRLLLSCVVALVLLSPGAALAHGETQETDPADGARVKQVPGQITISLSEPAAADSRFEVVDGCRDEVAISKVAGNQSEVRLGLAGGEPGRWKVSYRVISATDGHLTRDEFGFKVAGAKDCSEPNPQETDDEVGTDPPQAVPPEDGASFPVLPVVVGGGLIVGLALAVRFLSAR